MHQKFTRMRAHLRLLDAGAAPADVIAKSFRVGYEDLDATLQEIIDRGIILTRSFRIPDEADTDQPRQQSAAGANATMATLAEAVGFRQQ
jgi:hypothetical protein